MLLEQSSELAHRDLTRHGGHGTGHILRGREFEKSIHRSTPTFACRPIFSGVEPEMQPLCSLRAFVSMREQAAHGTVPEQAARDTAEHPLAQSAVSITACHDQVGFFIFGESQEFLDSGQLGVEIGLFCDGDVVQEEIVSQIVQLLLRLRLGSMLANFDDDDLSGTLQ